MDKSKKFLYKIPQGTEGLFLEDAFCRQQLVSGIQSLFTAWGYLPVQTPVFDFYDIYSPHLPASAAEKVYRLVDREGDLLMLRSDITIFLARTLGVSLREGHAPLRVCYADTILRHQNLEDISANEFFQIGAEFVGSRGPEGDQEILLLLDEILNYLAMPDSRIHLGTRGLVKSLLPGLSETQMSDFLTAVTTRRQDAFTDAFDQAGLDENQRTFWKKIFAFIGSSVQFAPLFEEGIKNKWITGAIQEEIQALLDIAVTLETLGRGERFRLDFSEVGRQNYYTGLVFSAYAEGVGDAIASGGRYDELLQNFGLSTPSVGFSFHLKKVEHLAGDTDRFHAPQAEKASGSSFAERFQKAQALRAQGKIAVL